MGLMSIAGAARMTVISEQADATVDRFIGVVSLSAACGRLFSFWPQLGLAVGAQHPSLRDNGSTTYTAVFHNASSVYAHFSTYSHTRSWAVGSQSAQNADAVVLYHVIIQALDS